MQTLIVATLVLVLIGVPVAAAQSAISFAIELSVGTVAAAVPFYTVLLRTSEAVQPFQPSRFAQPSIEDIVLGLAVPPLAAGEAVAYAGSLFGVTGPLASFAAILGASVGEIFALKVWQLDVPEWVKTIAVPVITSLGATVAFNRQAQASH
jgi:hypothetical protein